MAHRKLRCRVPAGRLSVLIAVGVVALAALVLADASPCFELPRGGAEAVWEAEQAAGRGDWEASPPGAGGEQYLQPAFQEGEHALLFPFEAARETVLRVRPVWWRTGEEKPARRFPYPLARLPGPDAVDSVGTMVFCTAPAAGRVVAVDAVSESVVGFIDIGGYLTDLVADPGAGRIYVADALGDRIVVVDAKTWQILAEFAAQGGPWSLALDRGTLYVACREGKRVLALDPATGEVQRKLTLDSRPVQVELADGSPGQVLVRFQHEIFDAFTLESLLPDELQYCRGMDAARRTQPGPGCGGPDCACWGKFRLAEWASETEIRVFGSADGSATKVVDVSSVVGEAQAGTERNSGHAGLAWVVSADPPQERIYFCAPATGRVGIVDPETGALEPPIEIGGRPVGLTADASGGTLYVTDARGDRVLVVDLAERRVAREIAVAGGPWGIAFVKEVAWQRTEDWQPDRGVGPIVAPTPVNRLNVACRGAGELVAIDPDTGAVTARAQLPEEPRLVRFVSMPDPDWWPSLHDEKVPFALRPRVAVEMRPLLLDGVTLEPSPAPLETAESIRRRDKTTVALGGPAGGSRTFAAANELVLCADGERWIDLTSVADPHLLRDRPLREKEAAGTITLCLDEGPEFDWTRGIWIGPDSGLFQVNDSGEFWGYNAATFRVAPGRHLLRVKAHSRFARFDAIAVRRSLEEDLELRLRPEPQEVHGQVRLPSYQGVFYDREPVEFTLEVLSKAAAAMEVRVSYELRNHLGQLVEGGGPTDLRVEAGARVSLPLALAPEETGRFLLTVRCAPRDAVEATRVEEARFLRLPKLEHPRLFWRLSEEPEIRARIAQYPDLFRRYGDWVERMAEREGRFPDRFLPPDLTRQGCTAAAPEEMPQWQRREACGWRMYELGWRILAVQFAARFLAPGSEVLESKVEALRAVEVTDRYCQYHHHGPFFPGAAASLVDLAPDAVRGSLKLRELFAAHAGEMDMPAWTLVTLEEPLTADKRALLYQLMTWHNNVERYFETHQGSRAGTWWMNPYTGCRCPMQGCMLSFVFLRSFFGEPRLFEKPVYGAYLTFSRYADPLAGTGQLQPERRGPLGEPWRWILGALSRHPVEKSAYGWEDWIARMKGPLPGEEPAAVEALMALEGRPFTGPLWGNANHFTSAAAVPVALALGWYDPDAAGVSPEALPPTTVFDTEGWVSMRSGWDKTATEVTFVSGVRDHTTRHKPNHFTVARGGEYLIGTPALLWDDGNNVGAWGNSVVIGEDWLEQWRMNLTHPRDGEHLIINRFSPAAWTYLTRDQRLTSYRASEGGYGAGLNLHGHTQTMFMQEGGLLAYQTWPDLDYVAGEADNAWPSRKVRQLDRQLVFLKPDLVVVYDRVRLAPGAGGSRWVAATAPTLVADGTAFQVASDTQRLEGVVLLPEDAVLAEGDRPEDAWMWKDQKLLEIRPRAPGEDAEYLVVLWVGEQPSPGIRPELVRGEAQVGVRLAFGSRSIEVTFNRRGPVGGAATIVADGKTVTRTLREGILDTYSGWRTDARYERWVRDPQFSFVIPEADQQQ